MDMDSLEAKLEMVEEEYRAGELTEKGYKKRKLAVQKDILQKEFDDGEITREGFRKKMARLESVVAGPSGGPSKSSASVANELRDADTRMKEKIQDLFGRKKLARVPKSSKVKTESKPQRKQVTIVCVDETHFAVPNRKVRDTLVKEGKIKEIFIGKDESESEVMERLQELFPMYCLILLKVTGSKDLIPAELPSGCSVLNIVEGMNLYVRGVGVPPPKSAPHSTGTQIVNSNIVMGSATNSLVGHTKYPAVVAQVVEGRRQFDKEVLVKEVHDWELFHFWAEHSSAYQLTDKAPVDEDVLQEVIARRRTLLYKDFAVIQWLQWRQQNNSEKKELFQHKGYVEVTSDQMDEFYTFKKGRFTSGTIELPSCQLLEYYNIHYKNFPTRTKYGQTYVMLESKDVDALCAWVLEVRANPDYTFMV